VEDSLYWHSIELFYVQRFVFASLVLHNVCKIDYYFGHSNSSALAYSSDRPTMF